MKDLRFKIISLCSLLYFLVAGLVFTLQLLIWLLSEEPIGILKIIFWPFISFHLFLIYILIATIGSLYLFFIKDRNIEDDRGFKFSVNNTFGSARLMSLKDLRSDNDLFFTESLEAPGIIFGLLGKKAVGQAVDGNLNKNILVAGSAGSGKTTGLIIPYLYQSIKMGESVITVDTKGDLYSKTSLFAVSRGYQIKVFNCREPGSSDSWNLLESVQSSEDVRRVSETIFECLRAEGEVEGEAFWKNSSILLLQALIGYVLAEVEDEPATIEDVMTLLNGYETGRSPAEYLEEIFSELTENAPEHPAVKWFKEFNAASKGDIKNSIIQNLMIKMSFFENPSVRKILSASTIDITLPGREKCIYYINLSEQDRSANVLASFFFRELCRKMTQEADMRREQRLQIPVTLLLDEFGAIGKIPHFDDFISGSRSRGIRCVVAFQNIAQIRRLYGQSHETILANCSTWISMGVNDMETAAVFSDSVGETTVIAHSSGSTKSAQVRSDQTGLTEGRRNLFTKSEIRNLKKEKCLVLINKKDPLVLDKVRCWEMQEYRFGEHINIYNYLKDIEMFKHYDKIKKQTQVDLLNYKIYLDKE